MKLEETVSPPNRKVKKIINILLITNNMQYTLNNKKYSIIT